LNIKAIIFDYGQVISLPQDPAAVDRMAEIAGVERGRFESTLWALRDEYDRGTIDAREYYRQVLAELSVDIDMNRIDEIIETDFDSWKNINHETAALMEDVKRAGYTLGILSNMPHDFLAWARKTLPVFSLPQVGLFSCEVNLVKPEKAIYQKLLSMLGAKGVVSGDEVVFFDDKIENIKGAGALGINALVWKDAENARRELLSLGVSL
jgi:putative hydrolase of the HAD superfamily